MSGTRQPLPVIPTKYLEGAQVELELFRCRQGFASHWQLPQLYLSGAPVELKREASTRRPWLLLPGPKP